MSACSVSWYVMFCCFANVCRWKDALDVFEKSLKLPGTGVKRFRSVTQQPCLPSQQAQQSQLPAAVAPHAGTGCQQTLLLVVSSRAVCVVGDTLQL